MPARVLDSRPGGALERDLGELSEWLAIPSVSSEPAQLLAAAQYFGAALSRAGARVGMIPTAGRPRQPGPPVVVGDFSGAAGSPIVLVYGHYDVQPAGTGWTTPPFRPVRRGDTLFGRGANDDKGQLFAVLAALRVARATGGPAGRVLLVAEGAEEIGSPGLRRALGRVRRRVRPDAVIVCDTERAPDGVPAVTVSQRGRVELRIDVDVGGIPVHPGRLGGAVVDPSLVLVDVLQELRAQLRRLRGPPSRVLSPSFRARMTTDIAIRSDQDIRRAGGGRAVVGRDLDRRITARPALTVTRMAAGAGPGTVPVRARAQVDVRVPAGFDIGTATARLIGAARRHPGGARVTVTPRGMSSGSVLAPRPDVLRVLDRACQASFGAPLRYLQSGGSLPAAAQLASIFGTPPVLLGLGTPGGGAHGPDERLDIPGWAAGVDLLIHLFASLNSIPSLRM